MLCGQAATEDRLPSVGLLPFYSAAAVFFTFAFNLVEIEFAPAYRLILRYFNDRKGEGLFH